MLLVLIAGACKDAGAPTGQASGPTTTFAGPAAGQKPATVRAGKLTACTAVPDPPFAFEDDGELDGIDIEFVRALAGRLNLVPTFEQVDQGQLFKSLDAGRCDIVASSMTITPERLETVDFSAPYFQVDQSLLVRKGDEARFADLPALAGRTIGVLASTNGAAYAKANAGGATVTEFGGADELLTALTGGQVDAALQDLPVNAFDAASTGETVVVKTFADGDKEQYGLAMKKGGTALTTAVDGALVEIRSDDTYPTILRRFLGSTAGQVL
ncbi:MAG: ABC transporter substrate-binding protein [Acidimicrobiales bacterium]